MSEQTKTGITAEELAEWEELADTVSPAGPNDYCPLTSLPCKHKPGTLAEAVQMLLQERREWIARVEELKEEMSADVERLRFALRVAEETLRDNFCDLGDSCSEKQALIAVQNALRR